MKKEDIVFKGCSSLFEHTQNEIICTYWSVITTIIGIKVKGKHEVYKVSTRCTM